MSVEDVKIKKLYIVNDGADDIDMLFMSCLLHPFNYRLEKAVCSGREVNVVMGYHEECIDELEFEVIGRKRTLYDVMYDLYIVDAKGRVAMADMIFVAEIDNDEYVEFDIGVVREMMWDDFVEEELEEEDDCEPLDEESYYELLMFGSDREFE
jgi:hypothetical protein